MSAYNRFLEAGGYCGCYDGFGFNERFNYPERYVFSGYGGCLCHYCRIKERCRYWRRRFR
ncbi:hypothetical protein [Sporomusa rhizae]|uniref:hypothetical protein n=1 Tax=Sporomusa rhizae TaxID=357999 RepID=UPI00352AA0BE